MEKHGHLVCAGDHARLSPYIMLLLPQLYHRAVCVVGVGVGMGVGVSNSKLN